MRKKRILLLSEGFGAGHTQAANALSVALRQLYPGVQTRVIELGAFLHPTLAPLIFTAYRKTVVSRPKLIGLMYRSQYKKSLNRIMKMALHRIFYAHTAAVIRQLKPDTIVCTHPFPNAVVARLKRSGLSVPLCTVITDYDAHGAWVNPEVNKYLVSTASVRNEMIGRGVPPHKIQVTGIPIHPNFWSKHNREDTREYFSLKNMPTALIMGGGWGLIANNVDFLEQIAAWADKIQLLFCMGNNQKTIDEMNENPVFQHPNIHIYGFTREVDKLMDASDLLITKPGGMTVTEGLAKGIPMLFYQGIPGNEEDNLQFFIENGLGDQIESIHTVEQKFKEMIRRFENNESHNSHTIVSYNPMECPQAIMQFLY